MKIKKKLEEITTGAEEFIRSGIDEVGLRIDMFLFEVEKNNFIEHMNLVEKEDGNKFGSVATSLDYRKKAFASVENSIKIYGKIQKHNYMMKPETKKYFEDAFGFLACSAEQLKEEIDNTSIYHKFKR